ncbi:Transcriptional regulator PadR-like family protein [uncultured Defluviicoccus sp.]|uniref:Transcriptional regulator PadR-like family protein n=1 Tax=metagenome TaxID=256318 RepID=A0A380T7G6_9ZZZZ|nr:Transcriptional regulator PadR-like family protein [uncultured Defluviicoccus sp.]
MLGYIASAGAVTSYAVAREFAASPSEFWSGSAGAVYPLMRRLEAAGRLAAESGARGRRAATWYSITPAGRVELRKWLLDIDRAAGMGFDPLRTRLGFMNLVSDAERLRFLDAVVQKTAARASGEELAGDERSLELNKSWFRMRLAWLRKLASRS